ncbi:hypothetical protein FOZ63_006082, partial [Perkinsus olseni]
MEKKSGEYLPSRDWFQNRIFLGLLAKYNSNPSSMTSKQKGKLRAMWTAHSKTVIPADLEKNTHHEDRPRRATEETNKQAGPASRSTREDAFARHRARRSRVRQEGREASVGSCAREEERGERTPLPGTGLDDRGSGRKAVERPLTSVSKSGEASVGSCAREEERGERTPLPGTGLDDRGSGREAVERPLTSVSKSGEASVDSCAREEERGERIPLPGTGLDYRGSGREAVERPLTSVSKS